MFAEMIDKIVSLKETKIFEIDGQTYSDANLTRIPPHVDRPDSVSVSGLDTVCKLVRTEIAKVGTTIMVHVRDYNKVEVMTTYARFIGGCAGCPEEYGYEPGNGTDCLCEKNWNTKKSVSQICTECWDRIVPGSEAV